MREKKPTISIPTDEEVARYSAGDRRDSPAPNESGHAPQSEPSSPPEGSLPADLAGVESMETLRRERDELKDKLLRAQAECANISKRLHQQHGEALKLAGMGLARNLLQVIDGFDRSLARLRDCGAEASVIEGIELLSDQFHRVLRDHGVEPLEVVGKPFDPMLHEAMLADRDSDKPPGTVTAELQRGYTMNDRILRPAKVAVASADDEPPVDAKADDDRRNDRPEASN